MWCEHRKQNTSGKRTSVQVPPRADGQQIADWHKDGWDDAGDYI